MVQQRHENMTPLATEATVTGYTLGKFLRSLRVQEYHISQAAVVEKLQGLLEAPYDRTMYSRIENDTAYPAFDHMYFIYVALRLLHVPITEEQRRQFLRLARERITSKVTHQEHSVAPADWEQLRQRIEAFEQQRAASMLPPDLRQALPVHYLRGSVLPDVRHVVGREAWLDDMLACLRDPLAPKIVVLQGSLGAGKSCALHALGWHLKKLETPPVVSLIEFDTNTGESASEAVLEQFLSAVFTDLGSPSTIEVMKHEKSIEERINSALDALELLPRSIILIDNAEILIGADNALTSLWQQFLLAFLRRNHLLTLIFATKEWPGWYGNASFVLETQLPVLSPQAGAMILQRAGFTSAPEDLLCQVSEALSNHPEAILWFARLARKKVFRLSYKHARGTESLAHLEEETTETQDTIQDLERALHEPHVFTGTATALLRPLLSRVISRRLSSRAQSLLELLAVARVAILPDALEIVFEDLYELHAQLESASLLVAHQDRYQLLPLVIAAGNQRIADSHREELERHLIGVYQAWVEMGVFSSEREQGQVIAELTLLLLSHRQLLPAAELMIQYGWLSFTLGYGIPIARRAHDSMKQFDWRASLENEVGGLLLHAVLARFMGESLQARERKEAYQRVYELAKTRRVQLRARTHVHLVHHVLRYLVAKDHYPQARDLIDEACTRYKELGETAPISFVELLDNKAYVQGRWGDSLASQARELLRQDDRLAAERIQEEAAEHWRLCVAVHDQCVDLLRQCERMASPLERSHLRFKLARFLNDISYYQRCLGNLEVATTAMGGCLELKEAGYSWPNSLAVSYGNWAQLLAAQGRFQQALAYRARALAIVERMIEQGDNALLDEKGMQLIEGAEISLLLLRLEEARASFEQGMHLVEGTGRRYYLEAAKDGLRVIEEQLRENPERKLDWRWFSEYHRLASFDAIAWLNQAAGPFTQDEQNEWNELSRQSPDEEAVQQRKMALVAQSRKRELAAYLKEEREPQLHYPAIPLQEVDTRMQGFLTLRENIVRDEKNSIVRRLYLEAIDERLDELHLVKASARADDEAFWMYMQRLWASPTSQEMAVAIDGLITFAKRGLQYVETCPVSQDMFRLLEQWHVIPPGTVWQEPKYGTEEDPIRANGEIGQNAQPRFSPEVVQRFFNFLFQTYNLPYQAVIDSSSTSERVDHNLHILFLPPDKWVSLAKMREHIAHEFEQHILRASNGARSPLALLGSGTAGYLETEEGLATYYALEVSRLADPNAQPKLWVGTLATGLASGVICPPLPFSALYQLFKAIKMLTDLLAGKQANRERLLQDAHTYAQNRCLRTFRGVSNLAQPGICSTKDVLYQRGYFAVAAALQEDPTRFDRLMVGAAGLHQLSDLSELDISIPPTPHQRIATNSDLERMIRHVTQTSEG